MSANQIKYEISTKNRENPIYSENEWNDVEKSDDSIEFD